MRTWEDYKNYVKSISEKDKDNMEIIEQVAKILSCYISKREELGLSQRDIANLIGVKQSSIARMESFKVKPQIDTVLKVLKPLGLTLAVVSERHS
ncbi:MAG: helix-turn-helix transcriptional regulator [Clostridia bacterium]|nr:helix-turn-helix transcriptional regulator [Clostridia bacterium]